MQTIVDLIQASCQQHADRIAMQHKTRGYWKELSYGKLWDNVEKLAAGIRAQGIQEKSHIALFASSSPRWVSAYLAILRAGCIVVPVDKELKANELRHVLSDADVTAAFVSQVQFEILGEILDDLPALQKIILVDLPLSEPHEPGDIPEILEQLNLLWQQLVADFAIPDEKQRQIEELALQAHAQLANPVDSAKERKKLAKLLTQIDLFHNKPQPDQRLIAYKELFVDQPLPSPSTQPDDVAVILYTSGTTGRSKGAMLSQRNITSNIQAARDHFQLDSSIHTLSFLPINHVFEQVCGVLLPLSLGGRISFAESIKKLGDNLKELKPTFLLGVPAVYRLLYDRIMKNIEAKPSARILYRFPLTRRLVTAKIQKGIGKGTTFISGGAALDPAISQGFNALGLTLLQGYGITETSPVISAESPVRSKPGTVGRALDGVNVRIDQPDSNGEGEILVKGPNVMLGYYKNPRATEEVLRDGWYHTGDLGRIDAEGMLVICGRIKNLIVTPNGKNVYPEEVENQLLYSPYIAEIMVYGHRVSAAAEEVYAVVYPDEQALFAYEKEQNHGPLSATEVEELIRREILTYGKDLADYKRIKKFTLRNDEFPKTTTRKIKRYAVEPEIPIGS